ncbi:MAG: penicillin-binding protein 1A [Selenomonadaceae bacterium]|nr:penicillin-binding protein 1A [Selenomonadaceae bacterium]MEE1363112.1 penicillin-binding protein 1A [Selenomonadaceae bacterium]
MEKRTGAARRTNRPRNNSKSGGIGKRVFLGVLIIVLVMVLGVGCGFLTATMNTREDLADVRPPASSQIYDINGNELANIHAEENRVPVSIRQIPKDLQNAFVAVEDNRFYDHIGVDPKGILRAVVSNITSKEVAEGGSTITQQLAKNAYLTQERTMKRKIQEVFLALRLEQQYTKQEILELYLNQIYFGQGAYGVQAAAKTYFGKDVSELDTNECAVLAGIPKSPNYYSPLNSMEAAQKRKATVLDQMVKYGYMNAMTANSLKKEPLKLAKPHADDNSNTPKYFVNYVIQELINKYGADAVYKDGLKIYTTIDMDMQRAAEEAMKNLPNSSTDANGNKQPQGALVAIDPATGYIKAMVGGRGTDQFNRATMAERQPGSAFKPFVFAAALESDYSPSSMIDDKPLKIGDWSPQNYNRTFNGMVSLRYTAEQSLNVPTVKLAQEIGLDKVIYYAKEMGISSLVMDGSSAHNDKNFAITLGGLTRGVTPLELTSAYGTFANSGVHVAPVAIIKVLDRNGKIMEEARPETKQVMKRSSAEELTSMLMGVVQRGTGTRANIGRPAAGKTGTTSDYLDAWFVGYVPDLVCGVWVGCDDNASLGGMTGGATPAVIWKAFMSKALNGTPVKQFEGVSPPPAAEKPSGYAHESKKTDDKNKDKKDGKKAGEKPAIIPGNSEKAAETGANSPDSPAAPAPAPEPAVPSEPSPMPGGAGKQSNQ